MAEAFSSKSRNATPAGDPARTPEPIAIIGLGAVMPGSNTPAEYFRNALRKRCFVRTLPDWLWEKHLFLSPDRNGGYQTYCHLGALLHDLSIDLSPLRIPPAAAQQMSLSQKLALLCARDAIADAGGLARTSDRDRTGVVIGVSSGDLQESTVEPMIARQIRDRLQRLASNDASHESLAKLWNLYDQNYPAPALNEDTLPGNMPSIVAGRIAAVFDLHGPSFVVDAACASSLLAIAHAVTLLRTRECDLMIAGGVDTDAGLKPNVLLARMGALSANGSYPFDARADGFVMGEGGGLMVLKRYADACRDGDTVYALIRGCGMSSDGAGKAIAAPNPEGQLRTLERAYRDAGISPAALHYVECHGTGTPVGDATELEVLIRFLTANGRTARHPPLPIGSAKAMVGHLKSAAGMAGLLRGLLAITSRVIPPQVNLDQYSADLTRAAGTLRGATTPEPIEEPEINVGVSGFGFGGANVHLVMSSPPRNARAPLVAAADFRNPALPPLRNDTAFLFPGQGTQYVGMMATLRNDPECREILQTADSIVQEISGHRISDALYPAGIGTTQDTRKAAEETLRYTVIAQPALVTVAAMALSRLNRSGLSCGMAIGHSAGELSALHAAGVLTWEDAIRAAATRAKQIADLTAHLPGAMAMVGASCEEVSELLSEAGGYVVCANRNAYAQTVVSGEPGAVDTVVARAGARGWITRRLRTDRAFHSGMMSPCVAPLRAALEPIGFRTPAIPAPACLGRQVYPFTADPAATGRHMPEADRQRALDLLCGQVDHPIDFIAQIELAYEAGIRRFVEIGPRAVLTGLVDEILQGKPFQAFSLDETTRRIDRLDAVRAELSAPLPLPRRPLPTRSRTSQPTVTATARESHTSVAERVRQVVADVSGYPLDRITDDVEFERDLGIDTLKIISIVARLRGTVLPADFRRFRDAVSVRRILAMASASTTDAAATPATPPASAGLRIFRYEETVLPQSPPTSTTSATRLRIIASPQHEAWAGELRQTGVDVDETADRVLVLWPLPANSTELAASTIPELREQMVALADAPRTGPEELDVDLVTRAPAGAYCAASYRAMTAFIKSLQKDLRSLRLTYTHIDAPQTVRPWLTMIATDPVIGRHVRGDGRVAHATLVATDDTFGHAKDLATQLGPEDVILVTGGARGIATRIVQRMLMLTRARFLLVSRNATVEPWMSEGGEGRVHCLRADLCDPDSVKALTLRSYEVTLLIHAAGTGEARPIRALTRADIDRVLGVKVLGLERVLRELDPSRLHGIILTSSTAAYFGGDGQCDYAAANGYLDGFVHPSVPVLSLAWSAWDEVGMATAPAARQFLEAAGVQYIPPARGAEAFCSLVAEWLPLARGTTNRMIAAGMASGCFLAHDPLGHSLQAQVAAEPPAQPPEACPELQARCVPGLVMDGVSHLVLDIDAAADAGLRAIATRYTPDEQAEIARMGSEKRRREKRAGKLAVKQLVRTLLQQKQTAPAWNAIEVLSDNGPVAVSSPDPSVATALAGLHFSISHSDRLVCAAAANAPVGIDAEPVRPLSAEVIREIGCAPDADNPATPIALFATKEAVLKATGTGLGAGLDGVSVEGTLLESPAVATCSGVRYRVACALHDSHIFALACAPTRRAVTVSHGQEALWFIERSRDMGLTQRVAWLHHFRGPLDVAALGQAVQFVADRQEALRTVFHDMDGTCRGEVVTPMHIAMPVSDVRMHHPPGAARAEAVRRAQAVARQPYDIAGGPLFRTALYRTGEEAYTFLVTAHHIVIDALSKLTLRRELAAAYTAFSRGGTPALPALSLQYAAYAERQRHALTTGRLDALCAYWRERLQGPLPVLSLPWDYPRPQRQDFRSAQVSFPLSAEVIAGLRALQRETGASLFTMFLAAYQILLMRLSGEPDVVVGVSFAGHGDPDLTHVIGYFVNMLPVRMRLRADTAFRDFLRETQETVIGAIEHADLPFATLVKAIQPPRQTTHSPVFQATIRVLHDRAESLPAFAGLEEALEEIPSDGIAFDLNLFLAVGEDGASGTIEYSRGLLSPESARALADRFRTLLAAIATAPDTAVSRLPVMDEREQRQILRSWNATGREYPPGALLHQLVEAQAIATPQAPAVEAGNGILRYGELNTAADRLASVLRALGVGPDVPVGLCCERSLPMVVGLLAILKAGGAFLPIDPGDPPGRVAFMLEDAAAPLLLTQQSVATRLSLPPPTKVLLLDSDLPRELPHTPGAHPPSPRSDASLAYILYTSGSTGRPKGAAIPHRAIVNQMRWLRETFPMREDDALLQKTPCSFDASVWEFFAPLISGARLVLARPDGHRDIPYLTDAIQRHRITFLQVVPSLLQVLLEHPRFASCTGLRHVFCGGEALNADLVNAFIRTLPADIHNLYGPTEVTINSVFCSIDRMNVPAVIPIGRPVANTAAYILDTNGQPVPCGVQGELCLGGHQVARGYHNRPDLTAALFVPDPFAGTPGARLFRTGDRARYRPDGVIEYLGRHDHQVKIRGARVDLEDVESVIRRTAGVSTCAVSALTDSQGDIRLVAYIAMKADNGNASTLREALRSELPDYMMPSQFVFLDALPLTPSGKVDRMALPPAPPAPPTPAPDGSTPETPSERVMRTIWMEVLARDAIGIDEDFFELGGHSMIAIRMVARVRNAFGIDLPIRMVFEAPTIRQLARHIETSREASR